MMLDQRKEIFTIAVIMILILTPAAFAQNSSFYGGEEETTLESSGEIEPSFRYFSEDSELKENLMGNLKISYPGEKHEFTVQLDYQMGAAEEIEFNEVNYKYYGDKYNFLIGKNRLIWGKGDQVHVVDNINGEDLSDFINVDYKERQIGEGMIKIDRYFRGGNANLEFVYTPNFTGDRLADDPESQLGNWIINPFPASVKISDIAALTGQTQTEVIGMVEDSIKEEYNQYALRFTDSRGGTDYGFSYYKGYLREPSYDLTALEGLNLNENPNTISDLKQNKIELAQTLNQADLHYDQVDVFGFEMARIIASINSRFELAYYRTDDTDGNNPAVRNNKIAWVVGGDRDLPISNLNLNLQFTGEKILDQDQIENNTARNGANIDLQYDEDGDYITNRAILSLEDSYQNGTIKPQLNWVYNLEDEDYSAEAAVEYEIKQDLIMEFSHKIFGGDQDTTFGQFEDNDYSSIKLKYSF